jgi:hypothetical protein
MTVRTTSVAIFLGVSLGLSALAFAEADAAKKYLAQAQTDVTNNDMTAANNDIQLAEAELDGLDDATKGPIKKYIDDLKAKIADAKNAGAKEAAQKQIDSMMNDAKGALDAKDSFDGTDKAIQDYVAQDDVKTALGPEAIAKTLKTLSTYRKVANNNAFARNLDGVKQSLDQAEKDLPDVITAMKASDAPPDELSQANNFSSSLDRIAPLIKTFPTDKPEAVEQIKRFKKVQAAFEMAVASAKAKETYRRLNDSWSGYADEYGGWDKETEGATFDFILHHQSDAASAMNAPKTEALIRRANNWLNELKDDEVVQAVGDTDPQLKTLLGEIRDNRAAAYKKMAGFASAILDQAEKTELNQDSRDRLETFANDDLRLALEGYDQQKLMQQRALKMVAAFDKKAGGDAATKAKLYDDLSAQSGKAWPAMAAKLSPGESFDAVAASQNIDSVKGQTIILKGANNRMGWDYRPGAGYDFAVTIDGVAVAGKYEQSIHEAVDSITRKTGHDFSDETYDVVATIDGMGPIIKITRSEGTISANGEKIADVTAQRDETVQGIRLKIIGLHVGPVASAVGQGTVDENGNVGQ